MGILIKMTDTAHGADFERDFAMRNGLEPVPASGSQWHSKLDNHGNGGRWSLKSTRFGSFQLSKVLFDELVDACEGPGGTGEVPLAAVQLNAESGESMVVVCMREEDFRAIAGEQLKLVRETKVEAKLRTASVPQLLREE